MKNTKICPVCGKAYTEPDAISRTDNHTHICPDCGIKEALESMNVSQDEQIRILDIIRKAEKNRKIG